MAHYAVIDQSNTVTQVITGRDEGELGWTSEQWEEHYSKSLGFTCKRTSYNTFQNSHLADGEPFRGNYAGIGFKYDPVLDIFIPPSPYPSWIFDESKVSWNPPEPYPNDGNFYLWSEARKKWMLAG